MVLEAKFECYRLSGYHVEGCFGGMDANFGELTT